MPRITKAAPSTIAPESHPTANILTQGFRTPLPRIPENQETMGRHMEHTLRAFSPRNPFHLWISDEIAMMMIRVDRIGRMDRRQRDQSALRAEFLWDHDRRLLAEDVGARLAKDPARVVKKLKATPQGCDWLAERWGWLQVILDGGKTWDEAQTAAVFDLLGVAPEYHEGVRPRLADPAKLVREELASLAGQKTQVAESDALDRTMAMTDNVEPNTAEYRSLKRMERSTHQRMKWAMALLELIPKFADAHPAILDERGLEPLHPMNRAAARPPVIAPPPAEPEAPPPLPQPWVQSAPPIPAPDLPPLPHPTPTPTPARRPDPVKLRAKARSDAARQRRQDRPDR